MTPCDAVADLAVELGLAGIVATNTTIGREGLRTASHEVDEIGAGHTSMVAARARGPCRRVPGAQSAPSSPGSR